MERVEADEARARARLAEAEAEVAALGAPEQVASRQLSTVEAVIAERDQAASLAARIDPPRYITDQLGDRPTNPA